MHFDERGQVAEIGDQSKLGAVGAEGEGHRVGGVVGNGESVDVDVANREALSGMNGFNTVEALAQRSRKNATHRIHGGLGDVERRLPKAEHLREAVAVVSVLVGDKDAVEVGDALLDGGEPGESFALAEAGVDE